MENSPFKKMVCCLVLSGLLLAQACSTGTGSKSTATLTPEEQEELDPMFWPMWGHSRGLGP